MASRPYPVIKYTPRKKNKFYVYLYIDPITGEVRYVGKGCGDRAFAHLERRDKVEFVKWMKELRETHLMEPIIKYAARNLLEDDAYALEKELIMAYGRLDLGTGLLFNKTNGTTPSKD